MREYVDGRKRFLAGDGVTVEGDGTVKSGEARGTPTGEGAPPEFRRQLNMLERHPQEGHPQKGGDLKDGDGTKVGTYQDDPPAFRFKPAQVKGLPAFDKLFDPKAALGRGETAQPSGTEPPAAPASKPAAAGGDDKVAAAMAHLRTEIGGLNG